MSGFKRRASAKIAKAALLMSCASLQATAAEWTRYTNPRTGVSVEYPGDLVAGGPVTDIADGETGSINRQPTGITLSSNDGMEIRVYGMAATGMPYDSMCARKCDGETYAMKRRDIAVVSGRRGDLVFYRRCQRAAGHLHCFDLEYPKASQFVMLPVIERMTRSLR